jgi:hypothetical protein
MDVIEKPEVFGFGEHFPATIYRQEQQVVT